MYNVKAFRTHKTRGGSLALDIERFLNGLKINKEQIVNIQYTADNEWLYCMIIWKG